MTTETPRTDALIARLYLNTKTLDHFTRGTKWLGKLAADLERENAKLRAELAETEAVAKDYDVVLCSITCNFADEPRSAKEAELVLNKHAITARAALGAT